MQFSYSTAVRRATNSSPFFLTYLCDPSLPYFQVRGGVNTLLGENWAADRFDRLTKICGPTQQGINAAEARDAQNDNHVGLGAGRAFYKWTGPAGPGRGPEPGRAGIKSQIRKKLTRNQKYSI